jgi:hypothetical protein
MGVCASNQTAHVPNEGNNHLLPFLKLLDPVAQILADGSVCNNSCIYEVFVTHYLSVNLINFCASEFRTHVRTLSVGMWTIKFWVWCNAAQILVCWDCKAYCEYKVGKVN